MFDIMVLLGEPEPPSILEFFTIIMLRTTKEREIRRKEKYVEFYKGHKLPK